MAPASQANAGSSAQPPPEGRRLEVRDVVRTIQKRRWLVLIILVVVTLAGGIFGAMAPRRYAATAIVLIHSSPTEMPWLGDKEQAKPETQVSVETQARLVATLRNAERTAEELAKRPGGGIRVSPTQIIDATSVEVQEPDIIRITVSMHDRNAVVPAANDLAAVYVAAARDRSRGTFSAAGDVLQKQIDDAQAKIDDLNKQRLALLEQGRSADVTLEVSSTQTLVTQLQADRDTAQQKLAAAHNSLPALRRAVAQEEPVETLPSLLPNPQYANLQDALSEKERQLSLVRGRYTEQHPLVQNALEEVADLQRRMAALPPQIEQQTYERNPRYDEALASLHATEAEEQGLTAQVQAIDQSLAQLRGQTKDLPRRQVEMDKLTQEIEIATEGYRRLVGTLQDHQVQQANRTTVAEVADEASEPQAVTAPLIRTLIFSVLLGLFCGVGLALVLEALDNTLRSPDEVARQTGLPLLGALALLEDTSPQIVTLSAPQSPASEAFRTLRSNIAFALTDLPARSFLVAAALGGEGRSSTAANLAVVTAHAGQAVILADTDLRKPVLADLFGLNPGLGLTNLLVGDATLDEVLQETGIPGLRLLASGPLPPNPAELLDSARMTELIGELHKRADVVLFDSPPALLLADAVILSSKVDRVLLIAEAGRVTVDAVLEVLRLMYHARASVLGVVLNRYRMPTASFYQHYYEEPPNRPRYAAPEADQEGAGT
jgi:succinoglycan biosynthesis transport protein ExoP